MINIGIISDSKTAAQISRMLNTVLSDAIGIDVIDIENNDIENNDIENNDTYNMLIINSYFSATKKYAGLLDEAGVIIINSDEKKINNQVAGSRAKIITYGFNQKACVTASSVIDSEIENEYKTVQCCIQRCIPTFHGKSLLQQEFSVNIKDSDSNINSVLASMTAALVNDVAVDELMSSFSYCHH